jgi:hypothetical protein
MRGRVLSWVDLFPEGRKLNPVPSEIGAVTFEVKGSKMA